MPETALAITATLKRPFSLALQSTGRLLLLTAFAATLPLLSFAQSAPVAAAKLPEDPDKSTYLKVCTGCHPPEAVLGRLDTPKNWARKVDSMVNRGAEATEDEVTRINGYLNRNFAFVPAQVPLPDGPGKEPLQKLCSSCHAAEIVITRDGQAGTRAQWDRTIDRMLQRGAKGSSEQLELIAGYLAANFGYIPVPSYLPNGPGKQTVERVCGPCHGVSLLMDRRLTFAAWNRTVNNMVGRGAMATPAEADEIADYLARYLGPKPENK